MSAKKFTPFLNWLVAVILVFTLIWSAVYTEINED